MLGLVDGEPVGAIAFNFHSEREAQVFILMDPRVRGRGFGRQLLREALATTHADRCTADVKEDNEGSIRCAQLQG
jgi:RimJ/RimL family protein N-acetyltransferase